MAAGLGQRFARGKDSWPWDQPHLNGTRQRPVSAACVTHRGEAAIQHCRQNRQGAVHDDCVGLQRIHAQVGVGRQHVNVAVDQARHQGLAAQIDHLIVRSGRLAFGAYIDNALALGHDFLT